ncbi:MAG: hypothetical protein NT105_17145 [Verrucomicrobia bacterium]|nr:hypothetical protein [Verrucomicrobiota bacterium]
MENKKNDDLMEEVLNLMRTDINKKQETEYAHWCETFAQLSPDRVLQLTPGLVTDIELQPSRWMRSGLELIESAKGTAPIQLCDGRKGPPMQTYLPYPVFQAGTELFLKGMWLVQHDECRDINSSSYVAVNIRNKYRAALKSLGHDILRIVSALEQVQRYHEDANIACFLKIISGVTRHYYYPLTADDKAWANARYPRRFYDDKKREAHADQSKSYPEQWPLVLLFRDAISHVDRLWGKSIP